MRSIGKEQFPFFYDKPLLKVFIQFDQQLHFTRQTAALCLQ